MQIAPEYLLRDFRAYIERQLDNKGTADEYYYAVCRFFRENRLDDFAQVTPELVLDALQAAKGRNNASTLKLGLKHLKNFVPSLALPADEAIQEIVSHKRDRSVRPAKTIYLEEVREKVMRLRNRKLKLAYLLMMASGLRVAEVAALEAEDIRATPDGITVNVRHGKGGSNGLVECLRDPHLEKQLPLYLAELPEGERPFYAAKTMKDKALKLGLECHDFRRIAAIQFRAREMKERREAPRDAATVEKIDEKTKDFLRHERFSTTKRYLYNRKLRIKLPEEEKGENGERA